METIRIRAGATAWTIGPAFLPGPAGSKPAIAALDGTHLVVAYAVGIPGGDGNGSKIQVALLDVAAPGAVSGADVEALAPGTVGLDQAQPSVAVVGTSAYLAWWTGAAPGSTDGEELWLKVVAWDGAALDPSAVEVPLPRWTQARVGDQVAPALTATALPPGGAVAAGWVDFGGGVAPGEANGDVVVELIPVPMSRTAGDGGP
jgi:hypothetical protein